MMKEKATMKEVMVKMTEASNPKMKSSIPFFCFPQALIWPCISFMLFAKTPEPSLVNQNFLLPYLWFLPVSFSFAFPGWFWVVIYLTISFAPDFFGFLS